MQKHFRHIALLIFLFGCFALVEGSSFPDWDVNRDGVVDISDLVLVGRHFGKTGADVTGDINGDEKVDISDLVLVSSHFGERSQIPLVPPEYVGRWKSTTKVFCVYAKMYLDIMIKSDGTFEGIYDGYIEVYTPPPPCFLLPCSFFSFCAILTAEGNAPAPTSGWIDFENNKGYIIINTPSLGETSFTFTVDTNKRMEIQFPPGWVKDYAYKRSSLFMQQ